MNFFPTRYCGLSNEEVNALYQSDSWSSLAPEERLDALQELENRSAEALGNEPCEVVLEQYNGAVYGGYADGQIHLNENLVNDGEFRVQYEDGNFDSHPVEGVNAQLMDTIHHENYHAYQHDAIAGNLEHDNAEEVELWRANWADENYIDDANNPLYRVQALEQPAWAHGEEQTRAAFEGIEATYGEDAGYQAYLDFVTGDNSYESALAEAQELYGDENVAASLNEDMLNRYAASNDSTSRILDDISDRDRYGTTEITGISPDGNIVQSQYVDGNGNTNYQSSYLNADGAVEHTTLHPTGFISDPNKDYQNNDLNPRDEAGAELPRDSDTIQDALDDLEDAL